MERLSTIVRYVTYVAFRIGCGLLAQSFALAQLGSCSHVGRLRPCSRGACPCWQLLAVVHEISK
jgi:hypothetical protein